MVAASDDHLSPSEVVAAIESLTVPEKSRLVEIAMIYARRIAPHGHDDLLQETILRVLEGRRRWPRRLPKISFLAGVARSIASDWRPQQIDLPSFAPDPEGDAIATLDFEKLLKLFSDDPIAQMIIIGIADGARGEELRVLSGLSGSDYESKRAKIRARIAKHFSGIWKQ